VANHAPSLVGKLIVVDAFVNLTLSDNTHGVENADSRIASEAIALEQRGALYSRFQK
jgi:small nuclear ribonucleoprotein (snRNP)-like protein